MGKPQIDDVDRDFAELINAMRNHDINAVKKVAKRRGYTDLHFAVMECNVGKIRRLLDKGANSNAANEVGMAPLHEATEYCPEAIPILIEHGADPHAKDEGDASPLHYAAMNGSLKAVEELIKHGGVNARDNKGRTPLHLALEFSHCDVAMRLIDAGAEVGVADRDGVTPLHLAARAGCVEAVKRMLELGADPAARDRRNNTVLHYAVKSMNKHVVELLIREEDVNMRNEYGETPLKLLLNECAAWDIEEGRCYEIAKILIDHGADPRIKDSSGCSSLDSAKAIGYPKFVKLLSRK